VIWCLLLSYIVFHASVSDMMCISHFNTLSVIFIVLMICIYHFRYIPNPHSFKRKGVTITSCWKSYSTKIMQLEYFIIHLPKIHQTQMTKTSLMINTLTMGMGVLIMCMLIRIVHMMIYMKLSTSYTVKSDRFMWDPRRSLHHIIWMRHLQHGLKFLW